MHTQLLAHLHDADVGVEGHDDGVQKELTRWDAVHDPPKPLDVVEQGFAGMLLQSVEVIERCRVRRAVGLQVMRIMAFHLFCATLGVGAGARVSRVDLNRALAMGIVDEVWVP